MAMRRSRTLATAVLAMAIAAASVAAHAVSSIDQVRILEESPDSVTLEVRYTYDGRFGGDAFASARMTRDGEVLSHYGYRPGAVQPGRGRTRIQLGVRQGAPELFRSEGLRIELYPRGGGAFQSSTVAFAKTWAKPGAVLPPVAQVSADAIRIRPGLRPQRPAPGAELDAFEDGGDGGGAAERRILPDGTIEIRQPDGTVVRWQGGQKTVTRPDGSTQIYAFAHAPAPTPPARPPQGDLGVWIDGEANRLIGIMRNLVGGDDASIDAYLATEGGLSPYEQVSKRTRTIDLLVQP